MSSLKKQVIRGAAWTFIGYGASQALRLVSNLILARLLAPEFFGLMALINVFIIGLNLFSDVGIGPSIIQNKRGDDPDFFNTAWTIQVLRGVALWIGSLIIAWPVAQFYGDQYQQLLWLVPIVGFSTVIAGFNSTSIFTLNRNLALSKLTIFEFGSQAIAIVVMVSWALVNASIWALVAGNIVGSLAKMLWSHLLVPQERNRFTWDKEASKEIFSFGKWIFIATAMSFLAIQADKLILGKLLLPEVLGIYSIALTFAELPRQVMLRISQKVIFPVMSKRADLPRKELRSQILRKRWFLLVVIAALVTFLVCFGDLLILTLYDERYADGAWMLPIIALGLWPLLLPLTNEKALLAVGKPLYTAWGNFLKFLYMIILLPLGFQLFQELGAIIIIAFNDLPLYGAVNYGLWREELTGIGQDFKATLLLIGLITLFMGGRYFLGFGISIEGIL
ncbi:MAG: oligosaccharide flippase family protein [Symploca sp. SIO2E6]|nr:oligosaccharide flippase family protein [Symploca sp. SIO2E6]